MKPTTHSVSARHARSCGRHEYCCCWFRSAAPTPDELYGVDNLTVTACGDVLVAEDGGQMRIVAVQPDGSLVPLMQLEGQDKSEITGPAFDPSGTRLYFSSQRGQGLLSGITYEITGPFHEPMAKGNSC